MRKQTSNLIKKLIELLFRVQCRMDPSTLQIVEEASSVEVPLLDEGPEWEAPSHEVLDPNSQEVFDARVRAAQAIRDQLILQEAEKEAEHQAARRALAAEASQRARMRSQRDQVRAGLDKVEYVPGASRMQRRTVRLGSAPVETKPTRSRFCGTATSDASNAGRVRTARFHIRNRRPSSFGRGRRFEADEGS
jgi:hypothetical protein